MLCGDILKFFHINHHSNQYCSNRTDLELYIMHNVVVPISLTRFLAILLSMQQLFIAFDEEAAKGDNKKNGRINMTVETVEQHV